MFHLSTFIMNNEENFDDDIQEYIYDICHSSNQIEAINLRTNALEFIDKWRLKRFEELDQRVRIANQLILNAFDKFQNKQQNIKCSHRLKQSNSSSKTNLLDNKNDLQKSNQHIKISIDQFETSSSHNNKISFHSIDFGRNFTFETLVHFSSLSTDIPMIICENNILIYSQNSNEIIIMSLLNSKENINLQLDKNIIIRDLCYVEWLFKCLVIADEQIYLLDYRTKQYDIIDSGIGYLCGAIDNHHEIFYLIKRSTLYKYDKNSLLTLQADQYPIADGYYPYRIILDNKTNDYLALLVIDINKKNYILVYSTKSFNNGYLYKILIDDSIERKWICSNGNYGWLIHSTYPGSCFDININGLNSVRIFNCNQIQNIIPMNNHENFLIRTNTEIFILIKNSFIHSF